MAGIIKNTVRQNTIHITGGIVKTLFFSDTTPTYVQIRNLGNSTVYLSQKGNVNSSGNYAINIIAGGTRVYTSPLGFKNLYFYSDVDVDIIVNSGEGEVYPNDLDQTQISQIVTNNVPLNVGISGSLPTGTNHIGIVSLDNSSITVTVQNEVEVKNDTGNPVPTNIINALPNGSNTIGNVNVNDSQFKPVKLTLSGGVDYSVKAVSGYVVNINTTLTDLILKNNSVEVYKGNYNNVPMYLDTNIVLNSATGGDVYIVYK